MKPVLLNDFLTDIENLKIQITEFEGHLLMNYADIDKDLNKEDAQTLTKLIEVYEYLTTKQK